METDSFFCQLLQQLPETLFDLLGLPPSQASAYRFDSVEVKKSLRIDGLFVPKEAHLPVYFVEIQFQRQARFYANLFAKVFLYLEANDPIQEWMAVALFPDRAAEPKALTPYEDLLKSRRVRRFYLDELEITEHATVGLKIVQLVSSSQRDTPELVNHLVRRARKEPNSETSRKVLGLVEELLLRRFTQLGREEVRRMFQLHDLRESRFWQEAHEEGRQEGRKEGRQEGRQEGRTSLQQELIHHLVSKGKTIKEIAEELNMSMAEVRRLAKKPAK
jgi:predicted transposase/invertase (TIGR01784 family)